MNKHKTKNKAKTNQNHTSNGCFNKYNFHKEVLITWQDSFTINDQKITLTHEEQFLNVFNKNKSNVFKNITRIIKLEVKW